MALVFRVGTPVDVFTRPFAERLVQILQHHFGAGMRLEGASEDEGWVSEQLGWSFLRQLQDRARQLVEPERIPHLLAMPAWRGAFLPVDTTIGELSEIWEPDEPIVICSLLSLEKELNLLAPRLAAPMDPDECERLMRRYLDDDERVDDDPDVQAWTQLVIGTRIGLDRKQPLWVIK
jgi:hypothetical protein